MGHSLAASLWWAGYSGRDQGNQSLQFPAVAGTFWEYKHQYGIFGLAMFPLQQTCENYLYLATGNFLWILVWI